MNCTVEINWKSITAAGIVATGLILVFKDPGAAKEALVHVSDAVKELASAFKGKR